MDCWAGLPSKTGISHSAALQAGTDLYLCCGSTQALGLGGGIWQTLLGWTEHFSHQPHFSTRLDSNWDSGTEPRRRRPRIGHLHEVLGSDRNCDCTHQSNLLEKTTSALGTLWISKTGLLACVGSGTSSEKKLTTGTGSSAPKPHHLACHTGEEEDPFVSFKTSGKKTPEASGLLGRVARDKQFRLFELAEPGRELACLWTRMWGAVVGAHCGCLSRLWATAGDTWGKFF